MTDLYVNIGDTVHLADPTLDERKQIDPIPTVADLLAESRAAHQRFQQAAGHNNGRGTIKHPDDDAAALAVRAALTARQSAEKLDPSHDDPAWAEDESRLKVTSSMLVAFYIDYFAPDVKL